MEINVKRYLELSLPRRSKDAMKEFTWLLEAASSYARSICSPSFRQAKPLIGGKDRGYAPISQEEVIGQIQAFTTAINAFFDEVSELRQITVRHDEPQTDGTARTD